MKIFEEYLKRHKIENKLVYHKKNNNIVFKNKKEYLIVDFHWKTFKNKPGKYFFNFYKPIKNNLKNQYLEECIVSWNQYEQYILESLVDYTKGYNPIFESNQVKISYLNIFSLVCKKVIPRTNNSKLKFIEDLKGEDLNIWNNEFDGYIKNYSYWIEKIW